ncbi:MAG: outer membrane protein transport protein [Polyangiaceae bacterium]|nr:outer membrane protein transport protein [Polyangiaceae bacterium]
MTRRPRGRAPGALALGLVAAIASEAHASGLFVTERGVRGLGRGGAFVAGADDAGAITYNPAGLFDAGDQFLIDASLIVFGSEYTRQALLRQIDPNTGETVATYEQTFPTVEGSASLLPIPTIAGTFAVHPDWRLGIGAYAPNAVLSAYPEGVDGQPAASRYQLLSLEGSALVVLGGYVAWRPIEQLRFGAGFEVMVGSFKSSHYLSGCVPDRFFCAPEDPQWDLVAQDNAAPIVSPSGIVGGTWEFYDGWRLGASFHLPYWVNAPSTLKTRLPSAPVYRNAEIIGEDATVKFQLPWELRLGLEMRDVTPGLRVELAGHYEHWAVHDKITIEPDGIAVTNVPGFPPEYYLPAIDIPRNFQSSISGMVGAEYEIKASDTIRVTPRLGFSYASSAVPSEYISVLTLDSGKATPSGGLSVSVGRARFDVVYAHQFIQQVEVAPEQARLPQVVPLAANEAENPNYINGGIYNWHIDVVGVGFAYTFDPPAPQAAEPAKPPEPAKPKPEGEGEAKDAEAKEDGDDSKAKPAKDEGEEE